MINTLRFKKDKDFFTKKVKESVTNTVAMKIVDGYYNHESPEVEHVKMLIDQIIIAPKENGDQIKDADKKHLLIEKIRESLPKLMSHS